MTVSPRRMSRARLAPRVFAVLAAASVLAGTVLPAAAASTPTPTPTPDVAPGTTEFTLAPLAAGVYTPGAALTVSVTLENGTASTTPGATAELGIGSALADRTALAAWLGDEADIATVPIGSATIDPVGPGDRRSAAILVAPETPGLAGLGAGVYPLVAAYAEDESRSVLVVPRDGAALSAGVIVPLTAGPRSTGLLTSEELTALTAPDGSLTDQLEGIAGTPAIIAVDPAIPASIRALGVDAPESAAAWLAQLTALPNERFALQFGDADPALQVSAGLAEPLAPTSLVSYMTLEDFPVDANPTPTPTPTPSPTGPAVPTLPGLDALLDVDADRGAVFWPGSDAPAAAVTTLGALSADDAQALTILPSDRTTAGADHAAVAARGSAGDAQVLVYDADVSQALSAAASVDESALRGAPLAVASAYLAFAAETGAGPVLAAIDRGTDRSHLALRSAISAVTEFPGAAAQNLTALDAASPASMQVTDAEADAERVADVTTLVADEGEVARFATILDDPALLTGEERAEMLQLLGVAWDAEAANEAVAVHRTQTRTTLEAVQLLPTTTINLFAAGAGLPFTIRNDLPYPVNLVLYATPDDLRLGVRSATDIVATPASNTRVEVPVEARVGNGDVTLELQLRSPSFVAIGPPDSVDVNVRAEWETVGLVVLSVIVGGLVTIGVVRTVLKARARRSMRDIPDDGREP